MSDIRDPIRDQPLPVPNNNPICHDLVVKDIRPLIAYPQELRDDVVRDLGERKVFGTRKYGHPLQPENGRSFLKDAYEENLDFSVYLRGKIFEEQRLSGSANPTIVGIYLNAIESLIALRKALSYEMEGVAIAKIQSIGEFDPSALIREEMAR